MLRCKIVKKNDREVIYPRAISIPVPLCSMKCPYTKDETSFPNLIYLFDFKLKIEISRIQLHLKIHTNNGQGLLHMGSFILKS